MSPKTATKPRTKAPVLEEPTPAPMQGPKTKAQRQAETLDTICKSEASAAARAEYRALMESNPIVALHFGDLPTLYRRKAEGRFAKQPVVEESLRFQLSKLRADLAGLEPTPIELLLVDAILAAYYDYWTFAMIYEQDTGGSFVLAQMEKWERILASKETRYLRAVETLARVRRLLKLPALQVNINAPGGQQVNVAGDVKGAAV